MGRVSCGYIIFNATHQCVPSKKYTHFNHIDRNGEISSTPSNQIRRYEVHMERLYFEIMRCEMSMVMPVPCRNCNQAWLSLCQRALPRYPCWEHVLGIYRLLQTVCRVCDKKQIIHTNREYELGVYKGIKCRFRYSVLSLAWYMYVWYVFMDIFFIVYPLRGTQLVTDILDTEADILDTSSRSKLVCWKVPLSGFVYIPISPALENLRKS